jgi:hypothetical protein
MSLTAALMGQICEAWASHADRRFKISPGALKREIATFEKGTEMTDVPNYLLNPYISPLIRSIYCRLIAFAAVFMLQDCLLGYDQQWLSQGIWLIISCAQQLLGRRENCPIHSTCAESGISPFALY